jgi:hypothetical protein
MTLVVARVTPLGVRLAGDMRVTDRNAAGPRGFLDAALKVILLRPTLCIAYAGNIGAALDAIRQVDSDDLSAEDAERHLLEAHRRSDLDADFLVASLRPSRLVTIKNGRAEAGSAGWIGDQEAFAEYQTYYHQDQFQPPSDFYDSRERADDSEIAHRISNGMDAVVHGPSLVIDGETSTLTIPEGGSHRAVGEAIVYVVPRAEDNLFKYSDQGRFRGSPFDPDAQGAFSTALVGSAEPGIGIVGLYIDQAQLGILYAPLLLDDPERYSGVSRAEFVDRVRERHGISLYGLGFPAPPR